jgi:hypothetical protein
MELREPHSKPTHNPSVRTVTKRKKRTVKRNQKIDWDKNTAKVFPHDKQANSRTKYLRIILILIDESELLIHFLRLMKREFSEFDEPCLLFAQKTIIIVIIISYSGDSHKNTTKIPHDDPNKTQLPKQTYTDGNNL